MARGAEARPPAGPRIAIVGGGITGLAAAFEVSGRAASVTVLEGSPRFGGNLVTEHTDGFLLDGGADSWVAAKPHATELARELGLGGSIITTNPDTRRFYIVWGHGLQLAPEGFVLGVPTRLGPLARTRLFSVAGKLRMAAEPFVPVRRFGADDDESLATFAARRLGREAAERLVGPLLGGISAGEASELSVRAAFPQLVAMEEEHGSLIRGMRAMQRAARAKASRGPRQPARDDGAFRSLEGGVGALVTALVEHLRRRGVALRPGTGVRAMTRSGASGAPWTLALAGGETLDADAVLLAVPAHAAAALLRPLDEGLGRSLSSFEFGSTATVFLGYRRGDVAFPLDGVGFVVPRALGRPILAGTWVSSKWAGRAPEDHVLVRAFFATDPPGPGTPRTPRSDDALVRLAQSELGALMGIRAEPVLAKVFRFERASAQMRVGHLSAMRSMREQLARAAPGVQVAGGGYDGIGIPDCIRQGRDAGRAMAVRP
jgi:oxygen-dependent protoporphyrinogen oxidase